MLCDGRLGITVSVTSPGSLSRIGVGYEIFLLLKPFESIELFGSLAVRSGVGRRALLLAPLVGCKAVGPLSVGPLAVTPPPVVPAGA